MHLCLKVVFPSKKIFSQKVLPNLVEREKQEYVLPKLVECYSTIISFDLHMSKGAHDIFASVINFLKVDWQLKHIAISLLKANNITRQVLARNLITLLDAYGLRKKIIVYVKDERANLNAMTMTLKFVVGFEILGLDESFQGT
jgi:hypothetical protein